MCSAATADVAGDTSQTSVVIISGGTSRIAGAASRFSQPVADCSRGGAIVVSCSIALANAL